MGSDQYCTAGSTPGKFFYETFGVGGMLETQGMMPQGIAAFNKTYIDAKTRPVNMVPRHARMHARMHARAQRPAFAHACTL